MSKLCDSECKACSIGSAPLTLDEAAEMCKEVPGWKLIEHDGVNQVRRIFKFDNFKQALEFTDAVGELAEENGHHPAILTEWGRVTVTYWTHKISGLHRSDFIMSAKTNNLYGGEK